ncbi:hypothetical protein QAD02_005556 [Eretmocerus hayati]|uniref:Uncharacterized protein n=1 Tax=Eretmocerus hayati TaxID=131215 RepID=A0ACC2NT79_9HYME|nr:hypothetical protein QAD02_005556 [Eretmocerus hayati]
MSFRKPYPNLSPWQQKRRVRKLTQNDLNRVGARIFFEQRTNVIPSNNELIIVARNNNGGRIPPVEDDSRGTRNEVNDDDQQQSYDNHDEIALSIEESADSSNGPTDVSDQSDSDRSEVESDDESNADSSSDPDSSDSGSSESEEEFDLKSFLREWSLTNNISLCATSQLLVGLRQAGHGDLPKDARTLLHTPPNSVQTKSIGSGSYAHYGLLKAILELFACVPQRLIPRILLLTVHVDGVKISKSSRSELFTILGSMSHCELFPEAFVIGAHYGTGKPEDVHEFMRDFLTELTDLRDNGFIYNDITYRVILEKISADTPAKNFLLNFPPHNSRCGRCIQDGFNIGRRRIFPENNAPLRTAQTFRAGVPEKYADLTSPLDNVVDPLTQIPIDPMHHYYLGVGKKHVKLFLLSLKSVGSDDLMNELDTDYKNFKKWTPMEFGRGPRKFAEFPYFKATEFRLLVLYTGPVIFSKYINSEKMLHFNLLNLAARYLSSKEYCFTKNSDAKELLIRYVDQMKTQYGEHNLIYNVHNLIHSPDDVMLHGTLDSYAAWIFENHLRFVRKNVRQGNQVLAQIMNRCNEQAIVAMSRSRAKKKEEFRNPSDFKITNSLRNVELPEGYEDPHKFIKFPNFTLTSSVPNNCCYLKDGSLISIQFICKKTSTGQQLILFKEFTDCYSIENYPIDSREIGICKSDSLNEDLFECSVELIQQKVFQINFEDSSYFFPILH